MRRTRVAALEDEVATLRQLVIEQGRQFGWNVDPCNKPRDRF
jgi:hypothetical protein